MKANLSELASRHPAPGMRIGLRITKVEPISLFVPIEEKIEAPISIPHAAQVTGIVFKSY